VGAGGRERASHREAWCHRANPQPDPFDSRTPHRTGPEVSGAPARSAGPAPLAASRAPVRWGPRRSATEVGAAGARYARARARDPDSDTLGRSVAPPPLRRTAESGRTASRLQSGAPAESVAVPRQPYRRAASRHGHHWPGRSIKFVSLGARSQTHGARRRSTPPGTPRRVFGQCARPLRRLARQPSAPSWPPSDSREADAAGSHDGQATCHSAGAPSALRLSTAIGFSPRAAIGSPQWRPCFLPAGGHRFSPAQGVARSSRSREPVGRAA